MCTDLEKKVFKCWYQYNEQFYNDINDDDIGEEFRSCDDEEDEWMTTMIIFFATMERYLPICRDL